MAVAQVETIIQNPARKRRRHPMARRMTLKQRLHFGTARQRAAAKATLKHRRRRNAGLTFHEKTRAHVRRQTRRLKRSPEYREAVRKRAARMFRKNSSRRHRRRSSNPGEIIAMTLGNPARKKGKSMAATRKRRRRRSSTHHNAGHRRRRLYNRPRRRHNPATRHHRRRRSAPHRRRHSRRHNPAILGGFKLGDVFVLGGGALVGSSLSSALPQWILGASNTGAMGYVGNFVATLILTWAGGMFVRNKAFPAGILAGGIGGLLRRIISDYSLVGPFGAQLGLGDYMVSNWVTPQRVVDGWNSAYVYGQNAPGNVVPISSSGASYDDTLGLNDTGKAAGIC